MFGMGVYEIGIIGLIAVLIFGPRQLPKLAKSVGDSIREMRSAGKELAASIEDDK